MALRLPACTGKAGAACSSLPFPVLVLRNSSQLSTSLASYVSPCHVRRQHAAPVRALGNVAMPVVTEVAKRALAVSASGSFASNSAAQRELHSTLHGIALTLHASGQPFASASSSMFDLKPIACSLLRPQVWSADLTADSFIVQSHT
jgi:hypothetical protein